MHISWNGVADKRTQGQMNFFNFLILLFVFAVDADFKLCRSYYDGTDCSGAPFSTDCYSPPDCMTDVGEKFQCHSDGQGYHYTYYNNNDCSGGIEFDGDDSCGCDTSIGIKDSCVPASFALLIPSKNITSVEASRKMKLQRLRRSMLRERAVKTPEVKDYPCDGGTCSGSGTCCSGHAAPCCPITSGTCCSDRDACCPAGTSCLPGSGCLMSDGKTQIDEQFLLAMMSA